MKIPKYFCLIYLFLFSLSVLAQNENEKAITWTTFMPRGAEFAVDAPTEFLPIRGDKEWNDQTFSAKINGRFFFIFTENLKRPKRDQVISYFLNIANAKPEMIKIGDLSGKKYSFKYSDDYFHNLISVQTNEKLYIFHAASEIENDEIVKRFFESIIFFRKLEGKNALIEEYIKLKQYEPPAATARQNQSSAPQNPVSSVKTVEEKITPLRILSKPRPSYTDFARFFDISGTVILRVTFLSEGKIGSVETYRKLPFGLTQNAIETARKITFEPQTVNGKPVHVIKLVAFGFSIY